MRAIANGTIGAGEDTFSYSYNQGANVDLIQIAWDIEFVDDLGAGHVIRMFLNSQVGWVEASGFASRQ